MTTEYEADWARAAPPRSNRLPSPAEAGPVTPDSGSRAAANAVSVPRLRMVRVGPSFSRTDFFRRNGRGPALSPVAAQRTDSGPAAHAVGLGQVRGRTRRPRRTTAEGVSRTLRSVRGSRS